MLVLHGTVYKGTVAVDEKSGTCKLLLTVQCLIKQRFY